MQTILCWRLAWNRAQRLFKAWFSGGLVVVSGVVKVGRRWLVFWRRESAPVAFCFIGPGQELKGDCGELKRDRGFARKRRI